ncbi:SAM-dependent methyltransferase [Catellatospora sp. NPDC049133]|uniref:SAM-dependent methyltransferase n=1 Tax=Catellatospora sp. NPDC049133 TaxID=3155499 RepID=UPI0033C29ED5
MIDQQSMAAVAKTALWTAAARARESNRPDRLFDDPFAGLLAGDEGRELLQHFHTDRAPDDGNPFIAIRTRWFDDFISQACAGAPAQVVALGAGLDTRWYRMPWSDGTTLFELDQASLLAYKVDRLRDVPVPGDAQRRIVPVAFDDSDGWVDALLAAGFDATCPTVWFGEGLLFYLPEQLAHRLLSRVAALSAPGSRLAVDLIGTGIFSFPYTREFLRRLQEANSPWRFGTDDPGGFVAGAGWQVDAVLEPGKPAADFGRWPAASTPPPSAIVPRSYFVSARR